MLDLVCPLGAARRTVRNGLASLFAGDRFPEEQYDEPAGDPGLFGPDSVTWTVHADSTESGRIFSRTSTVNLNVQAAVGVTGVKGRFVTPAGEGIA